MSEQYRVPAFAPQGAKRTPDGWVHILTVRPGATEHLLITGHRTLCVGVHWDGGRTIPHVEPSGSCVGCQRRLGIRPAAYLACHHRALGKSVLASISEGLMASVPDLHPKGGRMLRGLGLTLKREGESKYSPLVGWLSLSRAKDDETPPAVNVARALEVLWNLPEGSISRD